MFKEIICAVSMATGHHTCPDEKVLPVKATGHDAIIISQSHAGIENGETHIGGTVKKGLGAGNTTDAHLDILVKQKGKVIRSTATDFFPRTIPETRQGVPGRSRFALRMSELPPDAEIAVSVHRGPVHLCPQAAKK